MNLDFRDSIKKQGKKAIENKYGNLFEMYKTITGIDPYDRTNDDLSCRSLYYGRTMG